jgi:hypothetical protein
MISFAKMGSAIDHCKCVAISVIRCHTCPLALGKPLLKGASLPSTFKDLKKRKVTSR